VKGKRLAYLDSHFPWARSGFRYADALALHDARPDTLFFSMYELTDPFPARVYPLADFARLAPVHGITDAYAVFLSFATGLLGLPGSDDGKPGPVDGLDISAVLRRERIRLHVTLYPGGGLVTTEQSLARAGRLIEAADQVFSYVPEVLERYPEVVPIELALTDTDFYVYRLPDFTRRPLAVLFAADAPPRKGLAVALDMQRMLDASIDLELHLAGPHERWRDRDGRKTVVHGWCEREELRDLHANCPIFISPVRAGTAEEGEAGMIDGFPTGAAAEAMSSGCLLVSANPGNDHRVLRPGVDYVECAATPEAFADAVFHAATNPEWAATIARSGARRVRERMSVRSGATERLRLMGFDPQ
jgi:glycosyltransferase involved in cell wall biosynthesis